MPNQPKSLSQLVQRRKGGKTDIELSNYVFGKVPPQAQALEEAVLGALMLDKDAIITVLEILKPDSFYSETHQCLFKAMIRLFEKSQPIDLLTVTEELKKVGDLEKVGGPYYLVELTNRVVSSANLEYHARIVAQKFIQRELITISTNIIKEAYEDTTDVFELLDHAEQGLFAITEQNLSRSYSSMGSLLNQAIKDVEKASEQKEGLTGIPTGFLELDRITSGWQPSDLVIVAARPGMGKTSLTLALARNAADYGNPVAIFSLEMSNIQLVKRLISLETDLDGEKLRKGTLKDYEWQQLNAAVEKMSETPVFIDDTPAINIFELRAKCRRLKMQHDIKLVIIDYLQLMSSAGGEGKTGNREQEISAISRSLKGLAKELNIPVIALSQLSRAVETRGGTKRPQLSDLRECITGDTRIFLPESQSFETVENLLNKNGFKVLALDEESMLLKPADCLSVWETGIKEIFELETESGFRIKTSLNHPFYTPDGWTHLVDLRVGDRIASSGKMKSAESEIAPSKAFKDSALFSGLEQIQQPAFDSDYANDQATDEVNEKHESPGRGKTGVNDLPEELNWVRQRHLQTESGMDDPDRSTFDASLFLKSVESGHLVMNRPRFSHSTSQSKNSKKSNGLPIFWEKIVKIKQLGQMPTYDLHVDGMHNFMAENLLVHNSGAIEQDADMVTFIYRPEYYQIMEDEEGNSLKGVAEYIIAKHRNGSLGTVKLKFTPQTAKFTDWEDMDFGDFSGNDQQNNPNSNIITLSSKANDDFDDDDDVPF